MELNGWFGAWKCIKWDELNDGLGRAMWGKSYEEIWRVEDGYRGLIEWKMWREGKYRADIVSIVARYEDVGFEECSVEEYRLDNDYRVDNVASAEENKDKVFVTLFSLFR